MVFEAAVRNALRALILTGSLARDEAGFDIQHGRYKVRGDSEFLVVLKDSAADIPVNQKRRILDELQTRLRRASIDCYVSVGFVKAQYLSNIRPHIFGYELRACGVVVTGESDILSLIPPFSSHDVPLEDGWQLLSNRIIEFMEYAQEWIERPEVVSNAGRYRMVKLYLDMATSFLLFKSAYEPTYAGRAAKLKTMAQMHDREIQIHSFLLQDFANVVSLCTRYKIGCNLDPDSTRDDATLMERIGSRDSLIAAVNLAHSLWRWELSRLTGVDDELSDRQLMEQWMKLQPISRRLPGWGYVLRHSGWYRSWKHWPGWARNAWKASPRYWIYLVACELFFSLPTLVADSDDGGSRNVDFQRMRSCLILKQMDSIDNPAPLQQICSELVSNYREFLEGTRA